MYLQSFSEQACYDIREGSVFWKHVDMLAKIDGGDVPEWLSTHPANEKRVAHIDYLVPEVRPTELACLSSCSQ